MGGKVLYKFADEKEKEMHRGRETESMIRMLSQYKGICDTREVKLFYPKILHSCLSVIRVHSRSDHELSQTSNNIRGIMVISDANS